MSQEELANSANDESAETILMDIWATAMKEINKNALDENVNPVVDEFNLDGFSVYPNPNNGSFNVKLENIVNEITGGTANIMIRKNQIHQLISNANYSLS